MAGIIFHIDVNSAYLSWTAVERLARGDTVDLRLIPAVIGGDAATRHGVVPVSYTHLTLPTTAIV